MKKVMCYGLAVLAMLALTPPVFADTVNGTLGDGWQTWAASDLSTQNGAPYWNNNSSDGSQANVGFYLLNTGYFSTYPPTYPGPGSAIPFWGQSFTSGSGTGGGADASFDFTPTGGSQAALKIEVAGFAGQNTFGWYDVSSGTMHQLFSGPDSAGATATFTPTGNYGFYFGTPDGTFFTQDSLNTDTVGNDGTNGPLQHFALFQQGTDGTYWLGMEDKTKTDGSDFDYNDMIVEVSPVPEPGILLLLGLGLIGGAGVRRYTK